MNRTYYFRQSHSHSWQHCDMNNGSVIYHILFDMQPGEVYADQSSGYEYKWEAS